jgi:Calcineurin-like phosphoesterase
MRGILFMLCIGFFNQVVGQIVYYGCNWKYYDLAMQPPNQSTVTWKQFAYNDATWVSGLSELGYGDGDESTVISSATLTAYYRYTFNVDDPADFSNLQLQLTYDDGAVVYLNGVEIWRVNMPDGTITYNTFASSNSSDNAQASLSIQNTLVAGSNLLAVEIHQRSASSTDLSFNFTMTGVPAPGVAVVTRGPYLQQANDTSIILRWRTNIATASTIDYGISTTSLLNTVTDPSSVTEHAFFINSLNAATQYYYRIRTSTDTLIFPSSSIYFKTYPIPGTAAPLTAWILGDCGTGNNDARNVRNAYYDYIGAGHTDMMLFLGDNAYVDGLDSEYQSAVFQNMYGEKLRNTVSWSCLGNHDGHSANSSTQTGPYYDLFTFPKMGECGGVASGTEAYYAFDYGNIHFIVLDSYETDRSVGGPMYNWCEDDLQNTNAYWIIALWHHPPYSKGSHDSDVATELKQMRENFLPLFEDYGVDLVMSGHSHSYERTFLLNGHYGLSSSFNSNTHTIGITGDESGQLEIDDAYYKAPLGPEDGRGAVYVVTGSSGKIDSAPINH